MPQTKVFKNNKLYNITRDSKQSGIENRGYIDNNPNSSNQSNPLDVWYKMRAGRDDTNIFPAPADSGVTLSRVQVHDCINRLFKAINSIPVKLDIDMQEPLQVGYNFDKQKVFNLVEEKLLLDPANVITFTKDPDQFILSAAGIIIKNILNYRNSDGLDNSSMPILKTNIGEVIGQHKDGEFEKSIQGPFTEHNVGGYKHRHQKIGQTADRPERFKITDDGTSVVFSSPISSSSGIDYNIPYSRISRRGFTKSVVNARNIKVSGSDVLGNYQREYETIAGLDRRIENLSLIATPDNFVGSRVRSPFITGNYDYTLPNRTLPDGNYNQSVFVNTFGAPGEINSTNANYMDSESRQYSPYNTINYRNIGVRKQLRTLLSTASDRGYVSGSYGVSASYYKIDSNNIRIPISGTSDFKLLADNSYVINPLPARDGGYLWINNYALTGNNPGLYTLGIDNDILFLTNSADNLGFSQISSSFYTFQDNVATLDTTDPLVLRKYNIKINGLWSFTPKQQLTNHYNKIITYQRENNVYSDMILKDQSKYKQPVSTKQSPICDKYYNTRNVYEENGIEETLSYPFAQHYASLMANYYDAAQNKIDNFYKDEKNIRYVNKSNSTFKKLLDFDRYKKEKNIGGKKIKQIIHEEKIYPRGQNVHRNFALIRNAYSQSWSDSLDSRLTELTSSQGQVYSALNFNKDSTTPLKFSYWPLDANTYYDSVIPASRDKSGELLQIDNPALYATAIGSTYTIVVPSSSYFGARFGRNWNTNRPANVVHEQAGKGPYYDSYTSFYSDIKNMGQGYSIIPEYRISPKLDSHYTNSTSYYDDSFNSLELSGTVIEDLSIAINTSSAFIEQRVNSDYVDLNEYLNNELEEYKLNSIKLKVGAIKKLLPYDEFYPQQRMIKLAQQFSSSYSSLFNLTGSQATFRTALAPMYAPGIGFNSIKAGVGMPYCIPFTSSATAYTSITSSISSASSLYQKMPWETILYPYKNLQKITGSNIHDIDPDIIINSTASFGRTGSYNEIYDYKANNFYGEVINLFKDYGELSYLSSKQDEEWYFPDLTKKYSMDIVIGKRGSFYTYSSMENFGQKPYVFHNPPWGKIAASSATSSVYNHDRNAAPNSMTASGESYVKITFDPASMLVGSLDYGIQGKFKIGDVIRNSSIEYYSSMYDGITSSSVVQLTDIVDIFSIAADGKTWQPKLFWECPTADLNFYNLSAKLTNSSGNDSGAGSAGNAIRGIWHQYASISNDNEGLFLSARDSRVDSSLTGSLLDVVGFNKTDSRKIGKIASSAELSEALILIPFYQDDCGEDKYFDIEIDEFEKMYVENRGLIGEIKAISRKYNLPPALDYIRFRDTAGRKINKENYKRVKSPFLMFGFEFSSALSQQDLADIWQGVMPSQTTTAETDYKEKEFMIGHYLKDFNFKLPANTRFKVFKVKKKAIGNYQQVIEKTRGNDYIDLNYGYNWPYDYCSLVEMAEVKVELNYTHDLKQDEKIVESEVLNRQTISRRSI